ncbi:hypothetical protein [Fontivita pretiosa]|uniref:hypothetical protein n=1 Tax=Fontivita pretiosa TaxID=2989684 RepID=UPI003D176025
MQQRNTLTVTVTAVLVLGLAGCRSSSADNPQAAGASESILNPVEATFNVPPRQMVEKICQVLQAPPVSLKCQDLGNGVIVTDFERHPGQWRIARRWQERTRYRITVIPDWSDPSGKCRVQIIEQTEVRHAEGQQWASDPQVQRRSRAEQILRRIQQAAA